MNKVLVKRRGASLVEYALLVALIAVVAITAVTTLGQNISAKFNDVANSVAGVGGGAAAGGAAAGGAAAGGAAAGGAGTP